MRVFYRYHFDLTKLYPIQDSYKLVLSLLNNLGVSYKEMLYNINEFVSRNPQNSRKSNIQKVLDAYPQCIDYYFCIPCSF